MDFTPNVPLSGYFPGAKTPNLDWRYGIIDIRFMSLATKPGIQPDACLPVV